MFAGLSPANRPASIQGTTRATPVGAGSQPLEREGRRPLGARSHLTEVPLGLDFATVVNSQVCLQPALI